MAVAAEVADGDVRAAAAAVVAADADADGAVAVAVAVVGFAAATTLPAYAVLGAADDVVDATPRALTDG